MKKRCLLCMLFLLPFCGVFANADWDAGYMAGYRDAMQGRENRVEVNQVQRDSEDLGVWQIVHLADEFGDAIEARAITSKEPYVGEFSNYLIADAPLLWGFIIDSSVIVKLYEYGNAPAVGGIFTFDAYEMRIKESDGTLSSFMLNQLTDGLILQDEYYDQFLHILSKEEPVQIMIRSTSEYDSSTYQLGVIQNTGFTAAFDELQSGCYY